MRVTSALWVGAFVRRCNSEGSSAVVARRGSEEAGAILVIVERLDGTADLYGPAPQSEFSEANPGDRLFQRLLERAPSDTISTRLEKEKRFDPDVWIVAVENREGRTLLDIAIDKTTG
jgi:hypothetical protein